MEGSRVTVVEGQSVFEKLKERLAIAPVLAFLTFDQEFTLKTDASIQGLGAILSRFKRMSSYTL